jgi:RecA/RadA recombinase
MSNNALRDRILKNSKIKEAATIAESKFFNAKDMVQTIVPGINIALSGEVDGGLTPGTTMIAGPSKHFKTGFGLLMIKAFLDKYPDGVVLFYDTEFGSPLDYFKAYGIPLDSVIHTPILDVEELKFDLINQLNQFTRDDHVLIFIDSIGNIASKKEVDDALEGKSVADMTRAKAIKSLFRMITPHLVIKDIPLIAINHTYKTIEMYSKDQVSGGTGAYYGSDNIWIVGRQQDKDGKELQGFNFIINIEKSRYVKEKSKIPINISFTSGIYKWSGMFDLALEAGMITNPKQGWYAIGSSEKNMRKDDIEGDDVFMEALVQDDQFKEFVKKKYKLSMENILEDTKAAE